jgi:hypothetical protein
MAIPRSGHGEGEDIELTTRYSYDDVDFESHNEAASRALLGSDTTSGVTLDDSDVEMEPARRRKRSTPIPKLQLMTLCAVRIVDPIRYQLIYGRESSIYTLKEGLVSASYFLMSMK